MKITVEFNGNLYSGIVKDVDSGRTPRELADELAESFGGDITHLVLEQEDGSCLFFPTGAIQQSVIHFFA
jgi:hypothetical protein